MSQLLAAVGIVAAVAMLALSAWLIAGNLAARREIAGQGMGVGFLQRNPRLAEPALRYLMTVTMGLHGLRIEKNGKEISRQGEKDDLSCLRRQAREIDYEPAVQSGR